MRISNLDAVAALSAEEQYRLLESGDGPERLWSAWTIALRLGQDALPLLRQTAVSDVPAGLRQHLLVVLAGMGERQLLRAIAESEPSAAVRATATTLYLRTASDQASDDTAPFALNQLKVAPAEARLAILNEQELGQASIPIRALFATLKDAQPSVRVACATCVLMGKASDTHADAVRAVVAAFAEEDEPDVRRAFLSLLPRSAVPALLQASRQGGEARLLEALRATREAFGAPTWADVESIAPSAMPEVTHWLLASGMQPDLPEATRWLCDVVRSTSDQHSALMQSTNWRALHALGSLLGVVEVGPLDANDRALLLSIFQDDRARLAEQMNDCGPDSGDEEYAQELERMIHLLGGAVAHD